MNSSLKQWFVDLFSFFIYINLNLFFLTLEHKKWMSCFSWWKLCWARLHCHKKFLQDTWYTYCCRKFKIFDDCITPWNDINNGFTEIFFYSFPISAFLLNSTKYIIIIIKFLLYNGNNGRHGCLYSQNFNFFKWLSSVLYLAYWKPLH